MSERERERPSPGFARLFPLGLWPLVFLNVQHVLTGTLGRTGTARPAHYTVLHDDIFVPRFGPNAADELEKLTHELCYLFGRAMMAVSSCPPAYYADIVCTRARVHLTDVFNPAPGHSGNTPAPVPKVHDRLQNTMYYI